MIEFELPEPDYQSLTLADVSFFLAKGFAAPPPLNGRVSVGGPRGFKITAAKVAADPDIADFVDENADHEYYFLYLGVSFTGPASPKLESAAVKLTLTGVPPAPAPFALSMKPLTDGDPVTVKRTAILGPKLSLVNVVGVELGSVGSEKTYQQVELVVRGTGLASATPGWEFIRTMSRNLEGSCMLTMVVQAAAGAKVTVTGQVTARTGGTFVRRFGRELPQPLDFSAAI